MRHAPLAPCAILPSSPRQENRVNTRLHSRPPPGLARSLVLSLVLSLPLLASLPHAAVAQTASPPASQTRPADSAADNAAQPGFRSAFEGYRPHTDEKIRGWKQANDEVGQIGGWRAYAKEANQASAADSPAPDHGGKHPAPAAQPGTNSPDTAPKAGSAKP